VRRPITPASVVAVATVVVVLVVVVTFSVYGSGSAGGCRSDADSIRDAVAAFRVDHGADAVPTMSELVATGTLLQASVLHDLSYAGNPPSPRLTPRPGSGC
jgi:hypothetical protein